MTKTRRWQVDIVIDDNQQQTRARTQLHRGGDMALVGVGQTPHDLGAPQHDDTVAVARALSDLSRQLYDVASQHPAPTHRPPPQRRLAEIGGYVGGGLMLGGAALLVATSWADLSRPGRTALLATVTLALVIAGGLIAGRPLHRRQPAQPAAAVRFRLAGVLLGLAAATTALTAGTIAHTHAAFWAGAAGLVVAVLGYLAVRSVAGVLASAVLSAVTVGALAVDVLDGNAVGLGVSLVLLGLAWALLAATGVLDQLSWVYAVGSVIALVGAQQPLGDPGHAGWAYGMTFGVALLGIAGYYWLRSPILLAAGIVGLTIAIPEAVWDWTDGAVGGALIALIAGAVLLAASGIGLRLARRS